MNLRVMCKTFTCVLSIFIEIVKAAACRDTLRCRLREGCEHLPSNTRSFGVLDENKTRFFIYALQRSEGKAAAVTTSD